MGFGEQVQENMERAKRYKTVNALIQELPADGKWTKEERERWHAVLTASLDYCTELTARSSEQEK